MTPEKLLLENPMEQIHAYHDMDYSKLHSDIWTLVFLFMSLSDLRNLVPICKKFNKIAHKIWMTLVQKAGRTKLIEYTTFSYIKKSNPFGLKDVRYMCDNCKATSDIASIGCMYKCISCNLLYCSMSLRAFAVDDSLSKPMMACTICFDPVRCGRCQTSVVSRKYGESYPCHNKKCKFICCRSCVRAFTTSCNICKRFSCFACMADEVCEHLVKNKNRNLENEDHIVFHKIAGKFVAIGTQDPKSKVNGFGSLLPLNDQQVASLVSKEIRVNTSIIHKKREKPTYKEIFSLNMSLAK